MRFACDYSWSCRYIDAGACRTEDVKKVANFWHFCRLLPLKLSSKYLEIYEVFKISLKTYSEGFVWHYRYRYLSITRLIPVKVLCWIWIFTIVIAKCMQVFASLSTLLFYLFKNSPFQNRVFFKRRHSFFLCYLISNLFKQ